MSQRAEPAGSIYDLGYRRYDGVRLGRRHAVLAVYLFSLRGAFGLGRRTSSKIIPIAIAIIAAAPAVVQLGVGAIVSSDNVRVIRPENYFNFIEIAIALFCAAVAPEVMGRDQRTRTLPLYFSRALRRSDYALAKFAALATALLFLTLVPQAVLVLGNGLASSDSVQYWQDNWADLPRIVASGLLVAGLFASLSLLVAAQTPRRAYATVSVIALFVISGVISDIISATAGGVWGQVAVVLTPFQVVRGTILWIFVATGDRGSALTEADLPGYLYFAVLCAATAIATSLVVRRYQKIAV
jgi:ABC-2 type transport system permease protein